MQYFRESSIMAYGPLPAIAVAVVVFYYAITTISKRITNYKFSRERGCGAPNRMPQIERILGLSFALSVRRAGIEKRLLQLNAERHEKFGDTYTATLMGRDVVLSRDPENVKAVLSSQFKDFGLGQRFEMMKDLLGRGIFTADGAHWEYSRGLVRPNFAKAQVADLDLFEEHIQDMIARIPKDGSTVDMQPLFFSLTLDSATEFLFGTSVNSLRNPSEDSPTYIFGKSFDQAQMSLGQTSRMLPRVQSYKEFKKCCDTCHEFVDQYIRQALDRIKAEESGDKKSNGKSNKERYVFLDELAKSTNDPLRLRDELLNVLLAGRDTTASLLSNTWHVIARRPEIWAKLQAEVATLNGERPTYATLRNMQYLKYVLNESLRLYPVVPGNARFANKNTTIPRGGGPDGLSPLFIPKGSVVSYSVWSMHRRKDIYGPDAHEFRPERWASPDSTITPASTDFPTDTTSKETKFNSHVPLRPGWGYLPFNGGPRICVGQQFALTEASYTMVRLLQTFKTIEAKDDRPWQEQLHLTVSCANGVLVSMEQR